MWRIELKHAVNWELKMKFFVLPELPTPDIVESGVWRRAIVLDGRAVAVMAYPESERTIVVEGNFENREWEAVRRKLVEYLGLQNPEELYRFMDGDEKLRMLKNRFYGFGRAGLMSMSVFEGIAKAIIQQQISFVVAEKLAAKIVRRFGDEVEWNGLKFYGFPTQEAILKAGVEGLRECGLSRRKAELIVEIAKEENLEELKEWGEEEAYEYLTSFKGIGRWTAELVLSMALGKNVFPADDLGVRRAVSRLYFNGEIQSAEKVREIARERFGRFARDILFYLFLYDRFFSKKTELV
ncbi:MAG: 3-methyladenine DNA glycosylase (AlkA) [Archaeoglobus fulgidus]|uniref:3-methyladenine DNA glycosylase (AlkA) n=2 Tax=Archaeoglobus fulgidus TaxID=2234 RepID=A0A101DEM2_ARCFL|nr:DNA-3-methyladenine glycosylase [Archaeoglobus fulgidus]KUJ94161.1 MAG: 3-methyladenine DNA glycosylase (AlkA) [Archaeoglobus fulgidus]